MKSQIQKKKKKKNGGIVELLIPTLNKIIRNQDTYSVVIMNNQNNQCTCSPLKYGSSFLKKKKLLIRGQNLFWAIKLWGSCSKLED